MSPNEPSTFPTTDRVSNRVSTAFRRTPPGNRESSASPVPISPIGDALSEPASPRPETTSQKLFRPGTIWLLTDRCRPAWIAALDYLDDGHWHPISDLAQTMLNASALAPATITNHLASAGRRRWIERRRGRIRLRDRAAIEQALDATEETRR